MINLLVIELGLAQLLPAEWPGCDKADFE